MILNYRHNNRLLIFNYIIIIIILISIGSNIINCQKPIDYSEHKTIQLFNVDELNVYNTMVDCVTNWRQQFSQCNLEMSALGNVKNVFDSFLKKTFEKSKMIFIFIFSPA